MPSEEYIIFKSSQVLQIYLPIAPPIKLTDSLDPDYILGAEKNLTNECNEKKESVLYYLISDYVSNRQSSYRRYNNVKE